MKDNINPNHYRSHPSGVECIQITEHMSFNLGNVFKYLWRTDLKNGIEDLEKALWYLQRELQLRRNKAIGEIPIKGTTVGERVEQTKAAYQSQPQPQTVDAWAGVGKARGF